MAAPSLQAALCNIDFNRLKIVTFGVVYWKSMLVRTVLCSSNIGGGNSLAFECQHFLHLEMIFRKVKRNPMTLSCSWRRFCALVKFLTIFCLQRKSHAKWQLQGLQWILAAGYHLRNKNNWGVSDYIFRSNIRSLFLILFGFRGAFSFVSKFLLYKKFWFYDSCCSNGCSVARVPIICSASTWTCWHQSSGYFSPFS